MTRSARWRHHRGWRFLAAILVVGLASASMPSAGAQPPPNLAEGHWQGVFVIDGVATGTIEGAPYTFTVDLDGSFTVFSRNETTDTAVVGVVEDGTWDVSGDAEFYAVIPGQGDGTASWDLAVVDGIFGGSTAELVLAGDAQSTNGSVTSTVPNVGTRSIDIPDSVEPIEFNLQISTTDCDETYGTVDLELIESGLQAQGASTVFEGSWFAYVDQEAAQLSLEQWTQDMRRASTMTIDSEGLPDVARLATNLINSFNAWTDEVIYAGEENDYARSAADLMNDSAVFLNRLRNLTECEAAIYSDELLSTFETLGKRSLLRLGTGAASDGDLSADKLWLLHTFAVNAGALGASAPQPDGAQFEEAVRGRLEQILNDNVILGSEDGTGKDGLDVTNPEVLTGLAFGAQMDFQVTIAGESHSVRTLWERYGAAKAAADAANTATDIEAAATDAAEGE